METDGEGKVVSFKVVRGGTRSVSISWSVAFIGALEQLRDSSRVSEEKSLKKFFCNRFCGQNVDLDSEEGAGDPTIARSLSRARVRSLCR